MRAQRGHSVEGHPAPAGLLGGSLPAPSRPTNTPFLGSSRTGLSPLFLPPLLLPHGGPGSPAWGGAGPGQQPPLKPRLSPALCDPRRPRAWGMAALPPRAQKAAQPALSRATGSRSVENGLAQLLSHLSQGTCRAWRDPTGSWCGAPGPGSPLCHPSSALRLNVRRASTLTLGLPPLTAARHLPALTSVPGPVAPGAAHGHHLEALLCSPHQPLQPLDLSQQCVSWVTAENAEFGPLPFHFPAGATLGILHGSLVLSFCICKETGTLTPGWWPGLPGALSVEHLAWCPAHGGEEAPLLAPLVGTAVGLSAPPAAK